MMTNRDFKLVSTKTLSYNIIETVNRIDVINIACEEYVQEVLETSKSGNPTSIRIFTIDFLDLHLSLQFGLSDFLMKRRFDVKSSCEDPPDLELKDLPSHLEYAFLEGDDKLPVIIAKNLKDEDKTALIKVLNPGVSPVHCVPKKGGITVVKNEDNELIPTRLVTGWRVCIDYRKLTRLKTRKDHFPLPFMDQMLERLAGNEYYCFLDGFSGYFQILIDPLDQ
ncbi:hypothetical protein Tco_0627948 [Tanacetum coccineum]|uniref:Reverse transcriptase domain-containing protein n=1 Tax=Tanacetum coccineum TaxID=301880 RepID=A0ABQ4WPN9_9ASTR